MAVVEVQHEDALGEWLEINQLGSRGGRCHPLDQRADSRERYKPLVRKAIGWSHNKEMHWQAIILVSTTPAKRKVSD
jgi:hypothetical protein